MSITYRPDVDGLRALAVLSVIGFHGFPELFPGGFIGVDIFFVISGYLITSILLVESSSHGIGFLAFYARRILRIFPALIAVLAACLWAGWNILLADEYKQLGKHLAASAAFMANFVFWFEAGYFDKVSETKPLLHLWSLGIEEQFYIAWPFIMWVMVKARGLRAWLVAGLALISLIFASVMVFQDQTQTFYSPLTRAWELLAGALLAFVLQDSNRQLRLRKYQLGSLFGLFLSIAGILLIQSHDPFPGPLALVPVLSAMVMIAGDQDSWVNRRVLANPGMVKIGLISYPLYLWHWPLLSFAFIIESGRPGFVIRLTMVVFAFLLASLTYQFIEKPIKRLPKRFAIGTLITLMVVLGLLGKNVYDRDGLERIRHKRMIAMSEAITEDFMDFEKRGLITSEKCARPFKFPERDVCLTAHPDRTPTAAVIGDSHALHAYWGLAQAFERHGDNLTLLGRGACIPFIGFKVDGDADHCQPHVNDAMAYVISERSIKKVVLIFRGRYLSKQSDPKLVEFFISGLERTLQELAAAGKQVYYFLPIVEPGFDPRLCIGGLPLGRKSPFSCVIHRSEDDLKSKTLREAALTVLAKYPQVNVVDPNDNICIDDACPLILEGHSVFKDENHLSYYGSIHIGQSMSFMP